MHTQFPRWTFVISSCSQLNTSSPHLAAASPLCIVFGISPCTLAHLVLSVKRRVVFHWQHVHNASHPPEGWFIYSGPGLFSEDAQRKCLTLSIHCVIIIWSWRGGARCGVVDEYYQQMSL